MRKIIGSLLSALAVLFLNIALISQAEAARVAVVPIEIEAKVERANDFNGYYCSKANGCRCWYSVRASKQGQALVTQGRSR